MRTGTGGPALAAQTCERRLRRLKVTSAPVEWDVSWYGPSGFPPGRAGAECLVQASCGLMYVHGRDHGRPRRLGLDVASTAAGLLAAHGVLAALVARRRGRAVSSVETSVLQAGLLLASHYLAVSTSPGGFPPVPACPEPGPPFRSADGHWFEMETLDPEVWRSFWSALGAGGADLGKAWTSFRLRYQQGSCTLPPGLHDATARRSLADLEALAAGRGVTLCPLRSYREVLAGPGWSDDGATVEPVPGAPAGPGAAASAAAGTEPGGGGGGTDELPLRGVRVVEATNRVQGPLAGQLLRMLGAEVTLVEPPGGDPARMGAPQAGDTGAFFLCFNRGKASVELDLRTEAGRASLLDLAAGADVFLHNWRPGKAAEWGLDVEDLVERNGRLVYAGASGWGDRPPAPGAIGTDFLVQAHAGVGDGVNPEGEPPFPSRVLVCDYVGALVAVEGVLAGLLQREESGRGCAVRTSLLAAAMALQAPVLEALAAGREDGRRDGRPLWGLLDRPLQTADGWLAVHVDGEHGLGALCQAVDVAGGVGRAGTEELVAERLRAAPGAHWEAALPAAGVACSVVETDLARLPDDQRLSGLFEPLGGTARAPAAPWRFSP